MSEERKRFIPGWYEEAAPKQSYRSIFKWGSLTEFKHPNRHLYAMMKESFEMDDSDFLQAREMGLEQVEFGAPVQLERGHIDALTAIVSEENVFIDAYHRLRSSYGAGMIDAIRLRKQIIEHLPDVVLCPRDQDDLEQIVGYCHRFHLPIYVRGGGSSVTRGTEAVRQGVMIDMTAHMNRILDFNEIDQTITVEAGIYGPALEEALQHAPERFGAKNRFTLGHFPQSFEYSTVGGWVVTRGAGQNSTYYGKIEDMVLGQEYVTPIGSVRTPAYPRSALGPDLNQIMIGSEGSFGILSNATLKLCRYEPKNTRYFAYMFKSWQDGQAAMREIMQGEFGRPSVFRLSDPEETDVGLRLYGLAGSPAEPLLKLFGFQPMSRCLFLGTSDGDAGYTRLLKRKIRRVARKFSAFNLSAFGVTQIWEHSRFRDPYLREDLQDFGIITDTLECAVRWSQVGHVHETVRKFVKSHPRTICMTHISHAYPQGCNLYFIFIARMDSLESYLSLQYGILEAIRQSGAGMSHHHGIGKQTAPWFVEQMGPVTMGMLHSIKDYFDPNQIMNPGGTLGLDMNEEQSAKQWGMKA
ncbi:MAG: FAD-binding oxidoreductase [Anaerolineaceae bacterium]|nr:FAD-binding oxidoreductase [Anaerolineaceae bacterium]